MATAAEETGLELTPLEMGVISACKLGVYLQACQLLWQYS